VVDFADIMRSPTIRVGRCAAATWERSAVQSSQYKAATIGSKGGGEPPLVSIGVPVHSGEESLPQVLDLKVARIRIACVRMATSC